MARRLLENATWLDPEGHEPRGRALLVDGAAGRIVAHLAAEEASSVDAERVDLGGAHVAPGFIDLHYHGRWIFDDALTQVDSIASASASLVRHGVTAFLPTSVAWSPDAMTQRMTQLGVALESGAWPGALPIGLHLEGPWISPSAVGAQPTAGVRGYDAAEGDRIFDDAAGCIRMVTFAPEVAGGDVLQAALGRAGVVMALGHSVATAAQAEIAIERGARHVTHLWNAMSGLHHREPGLAGVALVDDRLSCDLICDGIHVDPRAVRLAARLKGDRLALITDQIDIPPDGAVTFGSGRVIDDGKVLRLEDGRLAGSRLDLATAVANVRRFAGWSLWEAIRACTLVPARILGMEAERGTFRSGARADFAVLDAAGAVRETWLGGARVG